MGVLIIPNLNALFRKTTTCNPEAVTLVPPYLHCHNQVHLDLGLKEQYIYELQFDLVCNAGLYYALCQLFRRKIKTPSYVGSKYLSTASHHCSTKLTPPWTKWLWEILNVRIVMNDVLMALV
jgi:hypothetical protein